MSFIDFARTHGVEIESGSFYESEKIHRCGTVDKPKSKNGAWFFDGGRGWVQNWADGDGEVNWFDNPDKKPWTEEERNAWRMRKDGQRANQESDYKKAAVKANTMLEAAQPELHNYLHLKGFPEMTGLVLEDHLLIPMRNALTGELQGLQHIVWNSPERKYDKKMLSGMRASMGIYRMGSREATETILVEGYATGLSVAAALRSVGLNAAVVVCFSAHNLTRVAMVLKGKIMAYADNDVSQVGEKAALDAFIPYVMSDTIGNDANDDHKKSGLFWVVRKIMDLRRLKVES